MTADVTTLEGWRAFTRSAYMAKADALEDALVALDAITELIPDTRRAELRNVEATIRDAIRECLARAEEGVP